jgi:proline iminopeptidase
VTGPPALTVQPAYLRVTLQHARKASGNRRLSSAILARMPRILYAATLLTMLTTAVAQLPHHTGTLHTPQVDLGYETFGTPSSGVPVIAINGGPGLSHAYMMQNDLWQRVAANRLVVLYDQRGTGASKHLQPNAPQTMDAQIADLEAVRNGLHLDKVALVGDSYGGLLALAYAVAYPQHVSRLVLSDTLASWKSIVHLFPEVFPDIEQKAEADDKRLAADPEAAAQQGLRNHFTMIFYSPAKRERYMAHMGDIGFVPAVGDAVSKATEELDLTAKLPSLKMPTLVLNGRYDMNVAPLTAWRVAKAIPGAKIVFFEESGHLPSYEEPEKYLRVLNDFLNSL